ncbi:MAG: FxLYD domain-containing protein [Bacillaceae bacterium]|nr:FxLYD domain-containing protein [Bacillaceae bacterium]
MENLDEVSATTEEDSYPTTLPPKKQYSKRKTLTLWLLPVVSILFVTIGLISYYYYEASINNKIATLNRQIESNFSAGEYEKAEKKITEALELRDMTMFQQYRDVVKLALHYEEKLHEIDDLIQLNQVIQASHHIKKLKEHMHETNYLPLLQPIQIRLENTEINLTVAEAKMELNELETVAELAQKLSSLSSFNGEEAEKIKQQILNKIVQLSYEKAEIHLQKHEFSKALYALETGLQYAINDEKLLSFIDRVNDEKLAFEKAEQNRLEAAMVAAAKEDLKNRTEAVDITSINIELDEFGDVSLFGDVINNGTTTIYSIDIHYSIFDEDEELVSESVTSVYPYELAPGETGRFSHSYYGVFEELSVSVESITWQID